MAPPQVTVMPAVRREITDWDEFTGRFVSTERVELRARISGYLDAVSFADGQVVQRGDLLFRIDPRPSRLLSRRSRRASSACGRSLPWRSVNSIGRRTSCSTAPLRRPISSSGEVVPIGRTV